MDTNKYCKHCGSVVETEYGKTEYTCPNCKQNSHLKDLVRGWTKDARMSQLKAMHDLMCEANDENLYMRWINLVPDGANAEDFFDIALDDDLYNECFDLFIKLVAKDGMHW